MTQRNESDASSADKRATLLQAEFKIDQAYDETIAKHISPAEIESFSKFIGVHVRQPTDEVLPRAPSRTASEMSSKAALELSTRVSSTEESIVRLFAEMAALAESVAELKGLVNKTLEKLSSPPLTAVPTARTPTMSSRQDVNKRVLLPPVLSSSRSSTPSKTSSRGKVFDDDFD